MAPTTKGGFLKLCRPPIVWQRLFIAVNVIMGAGMDSLIVDVVEVNVIMGAGMDSLVVDVVEVNVIMGAGMHSLVSDFAVNNSPERRVMENDAGWRQN